MIYMYVKTIGHFTFTAPSKNKNKKYDVFEGGKYICSFGSIFYQQYHDKIGYYTFLDHNDKERRRLYLQRHKNDYNKPPYPSYFSKTFLWT